MQSRFALLLPRAPPPSRAELSTSSRFPPAPCVLPKIHKKADELQGASHIALQLRVVHWFGCGVRVFAVVIAAAVYVQLVKVFDDRGERMRGAGVADFADDAAHHLLLPELGGGNV